MYVKIYMYNTDSTSSCSWILALPSCLLPRHRHAHTHVQEGLSQPAGPTGSPAAGLNPLIPPAASSSRCLTLRHTHFACSPASLAGFSLAITHWHNAPAQYAHPRSLQLLAPQTYGPSDPWSHCSCCTHTPIPTRAHTREPLTQEKIWKWRVRRRRDRLHWSGTGHSQTSILASSLFTCN